MKEDPCSLTWQGFDVDILCWVCINPQKGIVQHFSLCMFCYNGSCYKLLTVSFHVSLALFKFLKINQDKTNK